jgi:acetylornithine deacetylase
MQLETITAQSIHLLSQMIAIPSLSREEMRVATLLETSLASLAPHSLERIGNNVTAMWHSDRSGPTLLLCCNHDTLAPVRGWSKHPYKPTVEDDRVYGLGSTNSGASLVSMLGAIKASLPLTRGRLIVCLTAEKEHGTNGFRAIESQLPHYDAAIFGAPTNMGVVRELRGNLQLVIHSRSDTQPRSRHLEARNAIDVFAEDWVKIRGIDLVDSSRWGGANMTPTAIQGGCNTSKLPNLVTTTLDIRTTPLKSNEWILDQLKTLGIEFYPHGDCRKPISCDPKHPLLLAIQEASPHFVELSFDSLSDAAYATAPSVIMGPGKPERTQIADEFCTYSEIRDGISIYKAAIGKFLERALLYVKSAEEMPRYRDTRALPNLSVNNA